MKPVLFLDVDGVLNNEDAFRSHEHGPSPVLPECCERLGFLLDAVGCEIVLSSSWRGIGFLEDKLRSAGVLRGRHADGETKRLDGCRGDEIAEWLSRHPEVTRYAIVDDDGDMLDEQAPFFVQTSFKTGLTDEHCDRLRAILLG